PVRTALRALVQPLGAALPRRQHDDLRRGVRREERRRRAHDAGPQEHRRAPRGLPPDLRGWALEDLRRGRRWGEPGRELSRPVREDDPDRLVRRAGEENPDEARGGALASYAASSDTAPRAGRRGSTAVGSTATRGSVQPSRTGSTISEAPSVAIIPSVRRSPSPKMPRWAAIMRLPKPTTVVRPLNSTARKVLRGRSGPPLSRPSA